MAKFQCVVEQITVKPHPDADRLELGQVGEYLSITNKGAFQTGDLAVYIPEGAIVPPDILEELNLTGRLAGSKKNRVKALRLRGIISQGLLYPCKEGWSLGQDVQKELNVTKWEPPIPANLNGQVYFAGFEKCLKYDIENWKRYPNLLEEGEEVVFTEKLHGTWTQIGFFPEEPLPVVSSKGHASKGRAFSWNEANEKNLYCRVAKNLDLREKILEVFGNSPVILVGETFGKGCQDLSYGAHIGKDETLGFRLFDVYVGTPGSGYYLAPKELIQKAQQLGVPTVPVLYQGPYSDAVRKQYTDGKETVSGEALHIREGIVMRPTTPRRSNLIGRLQLKSISSAYLTRKGGTELN